MRSAAVNASLQTRVTVFFISSLLIIVVVVVVRPPGRMSAHATACLLASNGRLRRRQRRIAPITRRTPSGDIGPHRANEYHIVIVEERVLETISTRVLTCRVQSKVTHIFLLTSTIQS